MNRQTEIINYFQNLTPQNGMQLDIAEPNEFTVEAVEDALRLFRPFGWLPPFLVDGVFIFTFCPGIMDKQTQDLDATDFERYLQAIHWLINMHIIHHQIPLAERIPLIDDQLQDKANGSLILLSRVQLQALDST